MSQSQQECGCEQLTLTELPVHGVKLAVDARLLQCQPQPAPACRERVDQDMHIYIDGNLQSSGDGLSPQTAVKSFEDGVLALSRYDGCNLHAAHLHFLPLEDQLASYPDVGIYPGTYATFSTFHLSGDSHESTRLGWCNVYPGCHASVADVCLTSLRNFSSFVQLRNNIAFKPGEKKYAILSYYGGAVSSIADSNIYFHAGAYYCCAFAFCSTIYNSGICKMHTLGAVSVETGFLCATRNAVISFTDAMDYTNCTAVTGRKYYANLLSSISTGGKTLPGTLPGVLYNGSIYQ